MKISKEKFFQPTIVKMAEQQLTVGKHINNNVTLLKPVETMWYDSLPCEELIKKYGSPLFVASENTIIQKINLLKKVFQFPGYKLVIGYSFKTNYLAGICNAFLKQGCWAEVVSEMEYEMAKRLGVPGEQIIFNGPHKTDEGLTEAIENGSLIHIDNHLEYLKIVKISSTFKKTANVGIRFNFQYNNYSWDKFGFRYNEKEFNELFSDMAKHEHINLVSLHNHCGTYILEPDLYAVSVGTMYQIAKIAKDYGLSPTTIDIGGGFPSTAPLREQFTSGYISSGVNLALYADAIAPNLGKLVDLLGDNLTLVLEPGRSVVDEAVALITTVVSKKTGLNDSVINIIDAGVNILPTTYWYDREPKVVNGKGFSFSKQRVCGPLCMQIDVISESSLLPDLQPGTLMILPNVGAYNHTQSMAFIQYRPATVLLDTKSKTTLIQRKETFDDIFIRDVFPK